ncbi:MAG: glycosyltransferase family A protein [Burkholderiaceae bacterium]
MPDRGGRDAPFDAAGPSAVDVSVLMPMRDAGRFLGPAIASILAERRVRLELIVIDDGSTDGSREFVIGLADDRIRLVDGPRSGISACLNRGFEHATGSLLMRCDADDLYPAGRIAMQVDWLARRPGFVAVCGPFSMISPQGQAVAAPQIRPARADDDDIAPQLLDGRLRTHLCTFAFRRDAVARIGVFRSFFETAEDIDFQLRLATAGPVGFLPADAYLYRLHDASITHNQASVLRRFFEATARQMAQDRLRTGADALMRGEPVPLPDAQGAAGRADDAGLHMAQLLVGEAWRALGEGRRGRAFRTAWRAVEAKPDYLDAWKSLLLVCVKPTR